LVVGYGTKNGMVKH